MNASPGHHAERPSRYAVLVLAVCTLVVFGALGLARFGYTMVLPSMQAALGLDNAQAGMLASANLTGYLVLALAGGALAARHGPRTVIAAGLVVVAAGMVFTGLARGFPDAAVWRTVTGIGSGASNVPAMGLLAAWFARRRRGLAAGIAVTGSSLALIILGPLVPRLLGAYGAQAWRLCWFLFAGVTLGLALLAALVLRDHRAGDRSGAAPGPARAAPRLGWGKVYRSRVVWHLGVIYAAFGFSYIIYLTFFTKYLVAEGGYSQTQAGHLFMVMGWLSLLCGLIWGAVSDVAGRRAAMVMVYTLHTAAFALFAWRPAPAALIVSAVLFGLSAWSMPAIMAATCGDLLGGRLAPAGLGFVTLFFGIGQAAGPSAAGAMADAAGTLSPAMWLAAAVALCGALSAVLLHRDALG
jgi:predicted MFS family arabinose efflux permease